MRHPAGRVSRQMAPTKKRAEKEERPLLQVRVHASTYQAILDIVHAREKETNKRVALQDVVQELLDKALKG